MINSVFVLPLSFGVYKEIQFKLRNTIPTVMLQDNVFIDVVDGMTMLIGKKYKDGLAENVFIHDEQKDGVIVTMSARSGRFIEKDGQPAIILRDGQRFEMNKDEDAGATLTFETHTVSITPRERKQSTRMPIEMNEDSIANLLDPSTSPDERYINQRAAEGHYRIISPFLALTLVRPPACSTDRFAAAHGQSGPLSQSVAAFCAFRFLSRRGLWQLKPPRRCPSSISACSFRSAH